MATHADIVSKLAMQKAPGTFAHAARNAVAHQDFITLERMFPGVRFSTHKVAADEWQLFGVCEDGSTVVWRIGG